MAPDRGQSALEYMMTYGWAVLVILIVAVVLWQMGFLELSKNVSPDKRGFSQVTPLDWSLSASGALVVVVQNNAGTILDLRDATGGTAAIITSGGQGICTNLVSGVPFNGFRPAATRAIQFTGCPMATGIKNGDYYRVNLTLSYVNPSSGLPHISNGVIWGPVG